MAEKKKMKAKKWLIPAICGLLIGVIITIIVVVVVNVTKPGIVGKYTLSATINENGEETTATADLMKLLGLNYTIEFRNDGTGVLETEMEPKKSEGENNENSEASETDDAGTHDDDMTTDFTYSNGKIKAENDTGVFEADYEFKDDAVILNIGGEIMKFTRI